MSEQTKASTLSIILADDDTDDHLIFSTALKQAFPTSILSVVNNGTELLQLLENFVPDLVFLDLDMPAKNGLECLKEIRVNPALHGLPVVVYSSTNRKHNINAAYEMGANLFFVKPSSHNDIVTAIKNILSLDWGHPEKITSRFVAKGGYEAYRVE
jgi:DNA-binding NarL/FixJ family response regulator